MCGSFVVQSNGYEKDWEYLNKKTATEFYGCFFISDIYNPLKIPVIERVPFPLFPNILLFVLSSYTFLSFHVI